MLRSVARHIRFFSTPLNCSTPRLAPVHYQLQEFPQTHHIRWEGLSYLFWRPPVFLIGTFLALFCSCFGGKLSVCRAQELNPSLGETFLSLAQELNPPLFCKVDKCFTAWSSKKTPTTLTIIQHWKTQIILLFSPNEVFFFIPWKISLAEAKPPKISITTQGCFSPQKSQVRSERFVQYEEKPRSIVRLLSGHLPLTATPTSLMVVLYPKGYFLPKV